MESAPCCRAAREFGVTTHFVDYFIPLLAANSNLDSLLHETSRDDDAVHFMRDTSRGFGDLRRHFEDAQCSGGTASGGTMTMPKGRFDRQLLRIRQKWLLFSGREQDFLQSSKVANRNQELPVVAIR